MIKDILGDYKVRKVYYAKGVDGRYSYDKLQEVASKQLGATIENNDVIVFDNKSLTRRKVLLYLRGQFIIVQAKFADDFDRFLPLDNRVNYKKVKSIL